MDSVTYRAVPFRCATKTRSRPVPKLIQSKTMYMPWVLRTMIGGSRAYGDVGRLKSLKRTVITDRWIPGYFGQFALGAQPRQD